MLSSLAVRSNLKFPFSNFAFKTFSKIGTVIGEVNEDLVGLILFSLVNVAAHSSVRCVVCLRGDWVSRTRGGALDSVHQMQIVAPRQLQRIRICVGDQER